MNVLDIQDKLKSLSQDQLTKEMQMPSGAVPQFLVLGELNRRQTMRQSMQQQGAGSQTVAQEILNGAGVPAEGMSDMASSMAPKSSIAQNTGIGALPQAAPPEQGAGIAALAPQDQQPVGMFGGGPVRKMYEGQGVTDTRGLSDVEIARRRGLESFTLGDLFPDLGFTFSLDDTTPGPAIPGPGRSPVPAENAAIVANGPPQGGLTYSIPDELGKINPKIAPPPVDKNPQTGGGGGGGGGGAGPMSSYEKMLQDAMANAEKKAKQDKWLALAQAGMALMSSTSGSFAGALGEAGKVGIEALQGSRDVAEQNKLKLGQEMFGIEQARAAQARAAAGSSQKRAPTAKDLMSQLESVQKFINTINPTPGLGEEAKILSPSEQASVDEAMGIRDALVQAIGQMGLGAADLADPAQ